MAPALAIAAGPGSDSGQVRQLKEQLRLAQTKANADKGTAKGGNGEGSAGAGADVDVVAPGTGIGLYSRPKVPRVYAWEVDGGTPDGPDPAAAAAAAGRARKRKSRGPGCTVRIFDTKVEARMFLACGAVRVNGLQSDGLPVQ